MEMELKWGGERKKFLLFVFRLANTLWLFLLIKNKVFINSKVGKKYITSKLGIVKCILMGKMEQWQGQYTIGHAQQTQTNDEGPNPAYIETNWKIPMESKGVV